MTHDFEFDYCEYHDHLCDLLCEDSEGREYYECPDCEQEREEALYDGPHYDNAYVNPKQEVTWVYLPNGFVHKGKLCKVLYMWSGLLIKRPVVVNAPEWHGNLAGINFVVDHPYGNRYKIFSPAVWKDLVQSGWVENNPAWVKDL